MKKFPLNAHTICDHDLKTHYFRSYFFNFQLSSTIFFYLLLFLAFDEFMTHDTQTYSQTITINNEK